MKKVFLFMKPYSFIYKQQEHDFYSLNEAVNLSNSNMKIVILEEQLFIKIFEIKKDIKKISHFIQDKINSIFPQNGEILYDYEKNNSYNQVAIYSVKGKKRIEKLSKNAKKLEVRPIQLIVKEALIKKMKDNKLTCSVLFKFEDNIYYLRISDGLLYENFISCDLDEALGKLSYEDICKLYIDEKINYKNTHESNVEVIKINMEELVYDKLFKK